jgi:hypothetical protein
LDTGYRLADAIEITQFVNQLHARLLDSFLTKAQSLLIVGCSASAGDLLSFSRKCNQCYCIDDSSERINAGLQLARTASPSVQNVLFYRYTRFPFDDFPVRPFDTITCFAQLQHHFGSQASASAFFSGLSSKLAFGGHLLCTFVDPKALEAVALSLSAEARKVIASKNKACFGSTLRDLSHYKELRSIEWENVSVGSPFADLTSGYQVYFNVITQIAAQHDLVPLTDYKSVSLKSMLSPSDARSAFKHFSLVPEDDSAFIHPEAVRLCNSYVCIVFTKTCSRLINL